MSDLLPLPSAPPPDPPSTAINGSTLPSDPAAAAAAATAKRHRRPSVRLGDLTSSDIPLFRRLPKLPPLKTNFKPNPNPNPNRSRSKRPRSSAWTSKPTDDVEEDGFRSEFDRQSQSPSPSGDRENGVHEVGVEEEEDDVVVGVRSWLNRLGFGRYAPVFEIHEVDDEVLPLLTLEDLKDMGISAVGSRRKMFSEIQKLSNKNNNNF